MPGYRADLLISSLTTTYLFSETVMFPEDVYGDCGSETDLPQIDSVAHHSCCLCVYVGQLWTAKINLLESAAQTGSDWSEL